MTYFQLNKALHELKTKMQADGSLKDSYINTLNALITQTAKNAEKETPVAARIGKTKGA